MPLLGSSSRGSISADAAGEPGTELVEQGYDFLLKLIIIGALNQQTYHPGASLDMSGLGESGTGKSCLMHQFLENDCSLGSLLSQSGGPL
jgi:hypothetical protein